ncbi:MAG: FMN-binding protein, partial [Bacteroidaceae bacterium]|nr:FMN-binding protein [Bacteroidaceae bacterium]
DGVTGATLTSVGVSDMVQDGLSVYLSFINN